MGKTGLDFVIHVGLPKTGTTFLQKVVFPCMKEVNLLSRYSFVPPNYIITGGLSKNKINLISDESLFGSVYLDKSHKSGMEIADNLVKLFPDAKIIVTFREKEPWINSLYQHFLRVPDRYRKINNYDDFMNNYFDKKCLNFDKYESYLKKKFKEVLVLQYEDLKNDDTIFVKEICDFIGAKLPIYENIRVNPSVLNQKSYSILNRFSRYPANYYTIPILRMLLNKVNKKRIK